MHERLASARADGSLSPTEVRALLNVAIDLAEDFGVDCAVVVVDTAGALRGAERPGAVPRNHLDLAILGAQRVLSDGTREVAGAGVGAIALRLDGSTHGAVAVSGGPEGFALAACRAAAEALGL